jgi:cytochrome c oxidase subunit IV
MTSAVRAAPIARYLQVWAALIALLALSCASAFVPLGWFNGALNMVIALSKAALVAMFFMHLRSASMLFRLCAASALFALALLFGLSGSDYATRIIRPAAWAPPSVSLGPGPAHQSGGCAVTTPAPMSRTSFKPVKAMQSLSSSSSKVSAQATPSAPFAARP